MEAATALEKEGTSVEVLDLRSLVPLDTEAVLATARKHSPSEVVGADEVAELDNVLRVVPR